MRPGTLNLPSCRPLARVGLAFVGARQPVLDMLGFIGQATVALIHNLEGAHIDNLIASVTQAVDEIKVVVATPELRETIQALPATVANLNQTATSLRELSMHVDTKSGPLLDSLKGTSDDGRVALDQVRVTLQSVEGVVEPNSPLSTELSGSLEKVTDAARAPRLLANLLERNPSVLVRGKDVASQ